MRRYLNSNEKHFKKFIYTHVRMCDVHKTERAVHGPFSACLWSVQYSFESRLTSVLLKRSGVKRTVHGRFFLLHTVAEDTSPFQMRAAECRFSFDVVVPRCYLSRSIEILKFSVPNL